MFEEREGRTTSDTLRTLRRDNPRKRSRKPRRPRHFWSEAETRDLSNACLKYGVGAWKKMVEDPEYHFSNRTAVDLKDKFRASFSTEYNRLYGRFTNISDESAPNLASDESDDTSTRPIFRRVQRRKKHYFTPEEDRKLLEGVEKHGSNWAKICHDKEIGLDHRKSTDLRDRIRHAYPEKYEELGFFSDPEAKSTKLRARQSTPLARISEAEEFDRGDTNKRQEGPKEQYHQRTSINISTPPSQISEGEDLDREEEQFNFQSTPSNSPVLAMKNFVRRIFHNIPSPLNLLSQEDEELNSYTVDPDIPHERSSRSLAFHSENESSSYQEMEQRIVAKQNSPITMDYQHEPLINQFESQEGKNSDKPKPEYLTTEFIQRYLNNTVGVEEYIRSRGMEKLRIP
ncbi:hypothetical protein G9A89_009699 [Geosiphon pyriformis]|nr:hypothetical protein G9A89_009699 [Geosiphon pyriformis]